jgi:hypothetical protein
VHIILVAPCSPCSGCLSNPCLLLAVAEGKVWQKFDCEVARRAGLGAPGGATSGSRVVLDPEYRQLSRQRHQAAAVKTRTVQLVTDSKLVGAPSTVQVRRRPGFADVAWTHRLRTAR